jgi:acetoin utilization deacetylase AcuC-like enzyme
VLVERTLAEVAGTLLTAELALRHGLACNTAGGTHHAHRHFGSGFCIVNDLAVTAAVLLRRQAVRRVLIVDLDVHQVRSSHTTHTAARRVMHSVGPLHAASLTPGFLSQPNPASP